MKWIAGVSKFSHRSLRRPFLKERVVPLTDYIDFHKQDQRSCCLCGADARAKDDCCVCYVNHFWRAQKHLRLAYYMAGKSDLEAKLMADKIIQMAGEHMETLEYRKGITQYDRLKDEYYPLDLKEFLDERSRDQNRT